jgi:hypothetical protein
MTLERGLRRAFRSSEIRDFYDELIGGGGSAWVDGSTHVAVRMPNGKVIRMSTTATGRRYVAILRSKLRREADVRPKKQARGATHGRATHRRHG